MRIDVKRLQVSVLGPTFKVLGSALPLTAEAASLIEEETFKFR